MVASIFSTEHKFEKTDLTRPNLPNYKMDFGSNFDSQASKPIKKTKLSLNPYTRIIQPKSVLL